MSPSTTDLSGHELPWRTIGLAACASLLWLAPIVRGIVVDDISRISLLALVAGVAMVSSLHLGKVTPLWVGMGLLIIVAAMMLAWPRGLGAVVEPGAKPRTVVTSLLFAAIPIVAAYGTAREMNPLSWPLPVKLGVAVLIAFVSSAAAVCVGVMAHIAMGGEWL